MRSGCDMKSVMRSSILRGSNTNVGNVTLDRSIPTLIPKSKVKASQSTAQGPHSPQLGYHRCDDRAFILVSIDCIRTVEKHCDCGWVEEDRQDGGFIGFSVLWRVVVHGGTSCPLDMRTSLAEETHHCRRITVRTPPLRRLRLRRR